MKVLDFNTERQIGFDLSQEADLNIGDIVVVPGLNHLTEVEIIGFLNDTTLWGVSRCEFI